MKEIFNRRSIRKFENKAIEKEKIEKILRAGMQAPSAANQQPWEFIIVENKEDLKELASTTPYSKPILSSGVTIILLANTDYLIIPTGWQQDMGAVAQNILLEATYLELGAVWLGVATSDAAVNTLKKTYQLPDNIMPFAMIAIGYPDGQKNEYVDRYNESRVHYGKWA
jgi:nitroreductase